jgi:3-dehydroquinate dehydratase-1
MFTLSEQSAPSIVAVVATPEDLSASRSLASSSVDFCELRVDLLQRHWIDPLTAFEANLLPKILTVRDSLEGGASGLTEEIRLDLLNRWLPFCAYIDIELRNLDRYSVLVARAESMGKGVIISFHDFAGTPEVGELELKLHQAQITGNRMFKLATRVSQWSEVMILVGFLTRNRSVPIAAMGMGEFGKLSRIILARMGSKLSYCYLGEAVVPGQWSLEKLRDVLLELGN